MTDRPRTGMRRAYRAFCLGILVGCVLLIPLVLWERSGAAESIVLVDARLPLRSEGLVIPFTVATDTTVRVDLHLPAMLDSDVVVGPLYLALRPELVLEPEPREDRVHHIHGCETAPFEETFAKPGSYAIRIPSIPTAMGMESEMFVEVRITAPAR